MAPLVFYGESDIFDKLNMSPQFIFNGLMFLFLSLCTTDHVDRSG
jgi:hypothetical protein